MKIRGWKYRKSHSVVLSVDNGSLIGFCLQPERDLHLLHPGWTPERMDVHEHLEKMTEEEVSKALEVLQRLNQKMVRELISRGDTDG
jgi:hypothetical protein